MVRSVSEFHCIVRHKGRHEPLLNASQQTELAAPPSTTRSTQSFVKLKARAHTLSHRQYQVEEHLFAHCIKSIIQTSTFVTGLNVVKQQHFISNCASTLYKAF